jgi:Flp pilus assembly protein TadD
LEDGDLDGAIATYRTALRHRPNDADAHSRLGMALARKGDLEGGLAAIREALRLMPGFVEAHYHLGTVLSRKGDREDAIAAFREALRRKPDHVAARNDLGIELARKGKLDEAIACWEEVVRTKPDFTDAHANLAIAWVMLGKWDEAITAFREAARLKPNHAPYRNNLAWHLATCPDERLRNPRQAVEHARKAVELMPGMYGFWNTLGVAHYRNGEWQAAVEALTKSIELGKGENAAFDFFVLAMAHERLGDKKQARTWYDQAVAWMDQHKPKDEELLRFRAEAAALLGVKETAPAQGDRP